MPLISDHFDGRRFFNPHAPQGKSRRDVCRWRRTRQREPWPEHVEDVPLTPPPHAARDQIAVTFIGHSTFLVQVGGLCVLTDPIWSDRCSPVSFAGPRRVRPPGQSLDSLPGVDLLLVTHNHYDHMDLPTLRKVRARWQPVRQPALATRATSRRPASGRQSNSIGGRPPNSRAHA